MAAPILKLPLFWAFVVIFASAILGLYIWCCPRAIKRQRRNHIAELEAQTPDVELETWARVERSSPIQQPSPLWTQATGLPREPEHAV